MKKNILPPPNVGEILKVYMESRRYPKAAIARNAGTTTQTLNNTLKTANTKVHSLWTYCFALNHNFFQEIGLLLPDTLGKKEAIAPQGVSEEVALLQKRIEVLEAENALLLKLVVKG